MITLSDKTKRDLIIFCGGIVFCILSYYLLFKPKEKELPTIFDQQEQLDVVDTAEKQIEQSKEQQTEIKTDLKIQKKKNYEVFIDGVSAREYDSLIRAIDQDSRTADTLRNAMGL